EEGNAPSGASKETAGDTPVASRESDTGPGSSPDTNDRDSQDSSVTYASGTASPAAAKILREKGIDPATVKGTGKDGRITKEDAEKAQQSATPARSAASATTASPASTKAGSDTATKATPGERNERREKMTSLRRTIARRLVTVKN